MARRSAPKSRRRNPPLVEIDSYSRPRVYVSSYDKEGRSKKATGSTGRERYYRDLEKAIAAEAELLAGASEQARRSAQSEADQARKAWSIAGRATKKKAAMIAKYPGTCSVCGGAYIPRSDEIDYTGVLGPRGGKQTAHVRCISKKNPWKSKSKAKAKKNSTKQPSGLANYTAYLRVKKLHGLRGGYQSSVDYTRSMGARKNGRSR